MPVHKLTRELQTRSDRSRTTTAPLTTKATRAKSFTNHLIRRTAVVSSTVFLAIRAVRRAMRTGMTVAALEVLRRIVCHCHMSNVRTNVSECLAGWKTFCWIGMVVRDKTVG